MTLVFGTADSPAGHESSHLGPFRFCLVSCEAARHLFATY